MITGRRITGREAAAEVRVDMKRNGIVAGIGIIAVEVGAEAEITVLVIGITETVEEAKMMMRGVVEPIGVCNSPSPARRSLSPRRSPSPRQTTSRGGSPDALSIAKSGLQPPKILSSSSWY
ncbi:Hypothetical predicted protein [Olea europaea subsp. europaea]|uniref:Uncharacterized protein n=1 Tax=Olea europaea subsp. europaea TaxID=158383 RepID=A0A8S0PQB2_OLEEU|nr:Hypothetical predicted protein [Olea europaea subsp. europaea]